MADTATLDPQSILIIDDELGIRKTLSMSLEVNGHSVIGVGNAEDAISEVRRRAFDVAFLDLRLGASNGIDLIEPMLTETPWLKIVVITAHASIETAVEAMRRGATDYLPKPFTPAQVNLALMKAAELRALERRIDALQEAGEDSEALISVQSTSPVMLRVYAEARQVAASNVAVLLRGENGTGKTVLAKAIHLWSARAGRSFGTVSCPSLSPQLLESELFGHVRGAFTGAVKDNPGRISKCEGGTLFLDEIGDMTLELQPRLLRFLQDREYERVGETITRKADVRIIAATNVDLEVAVREGRFREDLFYRLNVVQLDLPPLRERSEDIPALATHMLASCSARENKRLLGFSEEAMAALRAHQWPGNLRELRNTVERACIFCNKSQIELENLPDVFRQKAAEPALGDLVSLEEIEERHIRRVLAATKSLQEAADILGIDQATLWRRRKKLGL